MNVDVCGRRNISAQELIEMDIIECCKIEVKVGDDLGHFAR